MAASRTLITLIAALILSGCSDLKNPINLDFKVTSIDVVDPTPTDEWAESDEVIDRIEDLPEKERGMGAQGLLSWTPDATRGRETESECRRLKLREILRSSSVYTAQEYGKKINLYFTKCEKALARGSGIGLVRDLKMTTLRYEVSQSPHIKEIEIKFSNGYKVRGFLAMKPDLKKRPLIIARCGVFCDVTDRYPRTLIMHLFDESPFNVLVLASTTGETFALDNKEFGIGGYLEAAQHMKLAEFLKMGGFGIADRISSIHQFGGSLGGNSALMTALLSDKNRDSNDQTTFNSAWAHCPVVNLEDTLEEVLRPTLKGLFMSIGANKVLRNVYSGRGWDFGKFRGPNGVLKIIKDEAHANYSRYFALPIERFSPFLSHEFTSIKDVWNANQFKDFATEVKMPLLAFAAEDDWIVHTDINTQTLFSVLNQNVDHGVQPVIQPEGRHCAQALVYGWSTMSEIYRNYFLQHSPEFWANERSMSYLLNKSIFPKKLQTLASGESHFSQKWELNKGQEFYELEFKIWSPKGNPRCDSPLVSSNSCFRTVKLEVPLSAFETEPSVRTPESDAEAQALVRWANSNVTVHSSNGVELENTADLPDSLQWLTY